MLAIAAALAAMAGPANAQFDGFGPDTVGGSFFQNYARDNILAVDLNNDGFDDLVTWGAGNRKLAVRMNNGTDPVSFTTSTYNPAENGDLVISGDFNGDGFLDLCGRFSNSNSFRSVRVYFGDGTGALTQGPNQSLVFGSSGGTEMYVDDIDQDGDSDILYFYNSSLRVAALYNDGNGVFSNQELIISESYSFFYGANVADVDGDGVNEIIVATRGGDRAVRVFDRPNTSSSYTEVFATPPDVINSSGEHIAIGDIDGDNDIDLVLGTSVTGSTALQVLLNDGAGTFSVVDYDGVNPSEVHLVNIDGDGDLDLVMIRSGGTRRVIVRLNDGTGVFGPQLNFNVNNTSANFTSMSLPDLDGNSSPDLAYRQPGSFVYALNLTPIFAPGPFALSIPADNATDLALPEHITGWQLLQQPKFTWGVPTGFGVTYDLSVSTTGSDPVEVYAATGIPDPNHPVPSGILVPGIEYAWQVTATNPIGSSVAPPFLMTMAPGPNPCPPDFNGDGTVNTLDFLAFLNAWSAGCP